LLLANGPDKPCAVVALEWKNHKEIAAIEGNIQFSVESLAVCFDIGDIKQMLVGPARKADPEALTHSRVRTVATSDITYPAEFLRPIRLQDLRAHREIGMLEPNQFRAALHGNAKLCEAIDQEPLVLILRIYQCVRKRAHRSAKSSEFKMCRRAPVRPEIRGRGPSPFLND